MRRKPKPYKYSFKRNFWYFIRQIFGRAPRMSVADKAFYKQRAKTLFWSVFSMMIIAWVGTNLVLCALTTNVASNWDISYEAPPEVILPTGGDLCAKIKNCSRSDIGTTYDRTIKTITFDYSNKYFDSEGNPIELLKGIKAVNIDSANDIKLYRVNDGADIYILSGNRMLANPNSIHTFLNCASVEQINFFNYSVTNIVTSTQGMFDGCNNLKDVDVSKFDMSNVISTNSMFSFCRSLVSLDMSGWKMDNVHSVGSMFSMDSKLKFDNRVIGSWKLKNLTSVSQMFYNCLLLEGDLDLSGWDVSGVTSLWNLFISCSKLTSLDLTGWDTHNVTDMRCVFKSCSSLKTIYASDTFVTSAVKYSEGYYDDDMFKGCTSLVGGQGTVFNSNYIDKTWARIDDRDNGKPGYFTAK